MHDLFCLQFHSQATQSARSLFLTGLRTAHTQFTGCTTDYRDSRGEASFEVLHETYNPKSELARFKVAEGRIENCMPAPTFDQPINSAAPDESVGYGPIVHVFCKETNFVITDHGERPIDADV